jgi:thymidylate kinase
MMKIVLAIEGMDGAGKSSLGRFVQRLCAEHGMRCSRIGRRTGYVSPCVSKLTQLLGEETGNLIPQAEVFARMSRESQRAHLAMSAPPGIVLLDRFVLTILAIARVHGLDIDLILPLLREMATQVDLHATIFVTCPFDMAWQRVEKRNKGLSSVLRRGEKLFRRVAEYLEEDFHFGLLSGQQWLVENSKTLPEAEEQVAGYLLPYLQKAHSIQPAPAVPQV